MWASVVAPPLTPPEEIDMRKQTHGSGLLVVVELGGEWPSYLEQAGTAGRRVLAQVEGESPAAFSERVVQGLEGLFGRGVRLSTLALACNERLDHAASAARRKLASLSMGAMAKHKSGRVCLTASPRSSGRLRHALSALAQDLAQEWLGSGLEASVEFGDESRSAPHAAESALTSRVA